MPMQALDGVRRQQTVRVEEEKAVALRVPCAKIAAFGETHVAPARQKANPRPGVRFCLELILDVRRVAVVDENEFHRRALSQNGGNRPVQHGACVITDHNQLMLAAASLTKRPLSSASVGLSLSGGLSLKHMPDK